MILAPIVLFVYNRPEHTKLTVEALQKNTLAEHSDLIIYSDAPKKPEAEVTVLAVREYIRAIKGFKTVTVIEQKTNFGLAKSIIDGVTAVVNEFGKIIVLEDDLIVTPYFLDFMNSALNVYEKEDMVIQVSGYMFPVKMELENDALFLPLTTSWGWATWRRAWKLFDPSAKGYALVKEDLVLRKRFNLDGEYDYFSMLEDQLAGQIDSWAIRWYLSTFLLGALTLYPRQSLVINNGFDGSGTHGDVGESINRAVTHSRFNPENFPQFIVISSQWELVRPYVSGGKTMFSSLRKNFSRLLFRGKNICI